MKTVINLFSILLLSLFVSHCHSESERLIITSDVTNFWKAYDEIKATSDTSLYEGILKSRFFDKASKGQKAMFEARNYSIEEYIFAIKNYPNYWESIRNNFTKIDALGKEMLAGIDGLRDIYPELKPGAIYFTVGCFRSPGTTVDNLVLIGSEMVLTDEKTITSELPESLNYVKDYCKNNPINDVVFLNVHEYVHVQQETAFESNLLEQSIREGVAEFIAVKATGQASISPAVIYGKKNPVAVKNAFKKEMFSHYYQNWLWSSMPNRFDVRDLGYYTGYAIADTYYQKMEDKASAFKALIRLDYNDSEAIEAFVDKVAYFEESLESLRSTYLANTPEVVSIKEFKNGDQEVDANLKTLTITFSQPMNQNFRNFRLGPLGEDNLLPLVSFGGFSDDSKEISFGIELKQDQRFQILVHDQFRSVDGVLLKPYLIDIKTKK